MPEQPFLSIFRRGRVPFLVTALAATAPVAVGLFAQQQIAELLLLGGLGALFILMGTVGSDWLQRFTSPQRAVHLYFAFQVLLANAIIVIGREQLLVAAKVVAEFTRLAGALQARERANQALVEPLPAVNWNSCASSPPAPATKRSLPRWSSPRARSRITSPTSSANSVCVTAPRPPLKPKNSDCSNFS